ncbi:MAG: hypothetical protein Q8N38_06315 [Bacteroidales bacterium]|nr:hypothetical protein [Bacteroidales bacterium]
MKTIYGKLILQGSNEPTDNLRYVKDCGPIEKNSHICQVCFVQEIKKLKELTTLFFIRYCLHLKVVMKNRLNITFDWQKIMRSEDHILYQSSR